MTRRYLRRRGDQRSSDTVLRRSDDYGHDDYGHESYHGGGRCSLAIPGLCGLLGVGALLAVGAASVAAIVLTVTMGRKRRSFPDTSGFSDTAAITKGEILSPLRDLSLIIMVFTVSQFGH